MSQPDAVAVRMEHKTVVFVQSGERRFDVFDRCVVVSGELVRFRRAAFFDEVADDGDAEGAVEFEVGVHGVDCNGFGRAGQFSVDGSGLSELQMEGEICAGARQILRRPPQLNLQLNIKQEWAVRLR